MTESTPQHSLGYRAILVVGALIMGLFVGSVTTVVHQNVVTIAGIDVPWGLALGLIVTLGFLLGLRLLTEDRMVTIAAALGLLGMVFLLSQESTGGSVLVPNNIYGTIWAIAPTLIAVVVIAWPKLPQRGSTTAPVAAQ